MNDRSKKANSASTLELARKVLAIEADAITGLISRLDERFLDAVGLILACRGRVVVSGVGKSGHIARKIASTLASTGTPAFFVHAAEAAHGDLGMITRDDVMLALSNSGQSEELLTIIPMIKRRGAKLIALTGNTDSALAGEADVHLDARVAQEACPLNLAPTASTTAALALGDALAIALLDARGFDEKDFARAHPGGALGRKLLTHVSDVMRTGNDVPRVSDDFSFSAALVEISRKGMGMTAILDSGGKVVGIFTRGHDPQPAHDHPAQARRRGGRADGAPQDQSAARCDRNRRARRCPQHARSVPRQGHLMREDVLERMRRLRLMIFDVDGVLTDGTLYFSETGAELKAFNARDGHGLKMLRESGVDVAILSARRSRAVEVRAAELGITLVEQGAADKGAAFERLVSRAGTSAAAAGYMGDDVVDLPVLARCGFAAAVPEAPDIVRERVHHVTRASGGRGAAREVCELIMRAQDTLERAIARELT